jgi:hypothetical protein
MQRTGPDFLGILRFELDFLENGGCEVSIRNPRNRSAIFQESPTCLTFSDPKQTHPCTECALLEFVPPEKRAESAPCHFIPLTRSGDSIESIESWAGREEFEDIVKSWLRETIKRFEERNSALVPGADRKEKMW